MFCQSRNRNLSTLFWQPFDDQIGQTNLDKVINPISGLKIHTFIFTKDKLTRMEAINTKWKQEDLET